MNQNEYFEMKFFLQDKGSTEEGKTDNDIEETEIVANRSSEPGEALDVVEGGKKDPSVRRHELLVKSGLGEVCCFDTMNTLFNSFNFFCNYLLVISFAALLSITIKSQNSL